MVEHSRLRIVRSSEKRRTHRVETQEAVAKLRAAHEAYLERITR